ncbi:Arm DNA-binding domain-containing protein [Desulfobacter postgatei]|uniref:Arm DNA-binding domain-containing protein n=1 Tax=Desulfobacter postgatei TaxID=2293 RepID=UPI000232BCF9|nr:Arm DNA-binding domain-containing protein [Desulfobacter postgatei]
MAKNKTKRFTDIEIKNLKLSPEKRYLVMESGGLGIRVKNEKTFVWRYFFDGRDRWFTIGNYLRVEASVTRCLPHRSVRAELPHTVPQLQLFLPS